MFDFSDTAACFPFFPPDFEYSAWTKKKEYQSYGAISIEHQCTISDKVALQWVVCTKSPIINGRSSVTLASATPRDNGILLKICRRFRRFLVVKIYVKNFLLDRRLSDLNLTYMSCWTSWPNLDPTSIKKTRHFVRPAPDLEDQNDPKFVRLDLKGL